MMTVDYKYNENISTPQFVKLLLKSTLAERRPVDDERCLQGMLDNSNLCISAWKGEELIGIARSVTDFYYACYLSDLAVDKAYQHRGVGKEMQRLTRERLGPKCKIILLAAPAAKEYYRKVGYIKHEACWVLDENKPGP